jgi:hypothetical protein
MNWKKTWVVSTDEKCIAELQGYCDDPNMFTNALIPTAALC